MGNAATIQGNAAAQNVQTLAGAELNAQNGAANTYGTMGSLANAQYNTEQQNAQYQANLALQNQAQINSTRLGYGNLGLGQAGQGLSAIGGYNNAVDAAEGQATAGDNAGTAAFSAIANAAGSASGKPSTGGSGGTSDARVKNDISDEGVLPQGSHGSMADDFLDKLHPKSFRYDDPSDELHSTPTGGKYLGVMAQDLVRTREAGPQMVSQDPRGKMMVETKPTLAAALAGLGRLNERVRAMEARGGR
jgi:hypothetical protein